MKQIKYLHRKFVILDRVGGLMGHFFESRERIKSFERKKAVSQ